MVHESRKVLLPSREVDFVDLVKNWVVVVVAILVIRLIKRKTVN